MASTSDKKYDKNEKADAIYASPAPPVRNFVGARPADRRRLSKMRNVGVRSIAESAGFLCLNGEL